MFRRAVLFSLLVLLSSCTSKNKAGDVDPAGPTFSIVSLDADSSYLEELCKLDPIGLVLAGGEASELVQEVRALPANTPPEADEREELARRISRIVENPDQLGDLSKGLPEDVAVVGDILGTRCG